MLHSLDLENASVQLTPCHSTDLAWPWLEGLAYDTEMIWLWDLISGGVVSAIVGASSSCVSRSPPDLLAQLPITANISIYTKKSWGLLQHLLSGSTTEWSGRSRGSDQLRNKGRLNLRPCLDRAMDACTDNASNLCLFKGNTHFSTPFLWGKIPV